MLNNRRTCLLRSVVVCLLVSLLLSIPCAAYGEAAVPFIRLDKDDPDYWQGELSNVRLIAGQLYELQEMDAESGVDPDFMPFYGRPVSAVQATGSRTSRQRWAAGNAARSWSLTSGAENKRICKNGNFRKSSHFCMDCT